MVAAFSRLYMNEIKQEFFFFVVVVFVLTRYAPLQFQTKDE